MIRYSGIGVDPDDVAETEADHFGNCPVCAGPAAADPPVSWNRLLTPLDNRSSTPFFHGCPKRGGGDG
jgi:hypothetical protein